MKSPSVTGRQSSNYHGKEMYAHLILIWFLYNTLSMLLYAGNRPMYVPISHSSFSPLLLAAAPPPFVFGSELPCHGSPRWLT
jgi:hypothetical protein